MSWAISSYFNVFRSYSFSAMSRTRSSQDQDKISETSWLQCGGLKEWRLEVHLFTSRESAI
jgi:hypothetical protein